MININTPGRSWVLSPKLEEYARGQSEDVSGHSLGWVILAKIARKRLSTGEAVKSIEPVAFIDYEKHFKLRREVELATKMWLENERRAYHARLAWLAIGSLVFVAVVLTVARSWY